MKQLLKVSLQTKILILVITLIMAVIILLMGVFVYLETKAEWHQKDILSLQTAKMVSYMPVVKSALNGEGSLEELEALAEHVREDSGASAVIITDTDGRIYTHPDRSMLGKKVNMDDNYMATVFGGYYTTEAKSPIGTVIRGKAPVFSNHGDYQSLSGVVSVSFYKAPVFSIIMNKTRESLFFVLLVLTVGITGGVLLARNIKKETLGLEPFEIASLYRERNAILYSIKEGIIAIDKNGLITMFNQSAAELLGLKSDYIGKEIRSILPTTRMIHIIETGEAEQDQEMQVNDRTLVVNRTPVTDKDEIVGVVSSFRDKTEIIGMINTISEVRKYSEDLRAQTHEFTNKLYVLSGLLQLGQYEEAINMIQEESGSHSQLNRILFDQIHDPKVQAVLLGKIGKASEKKTEFIIDPSSSLARLPDHIGISHLVTLIGNLVDNAIDAVQGQKNGTVSFFVTDMGHDFIFEIEDDGPGVESEVMDRIFAKGFSLKKGRDRGYGLSNVQQVLEELGGAIEVQNRPEGGAVFSLFIPKKVKNNDQSSSG